MSDTLVSVLAAALKQLLPKPESGNMAFVRCLPGEIAGRLVSSTARDGLAGWRITFVTESDDSTEGYIGATQAVRLRNEKGDPVFFAIDPEQAGAGLDGIFNATNEICETELFLQAVNEAQKRLPHGVKAFASKALSKAGWQKRRQPLPPWPALDYLCRACDDTQSLGNALTLIGLWPIAVGAHLDPKDLEQSAMLVERLLPTQGARPAPSQRAASLSLGPEQQATAEQLVEYLQTVDSLPRQQALDGLLERSALWLNNLRLPPPGELQGISILPWRRANGNIYAWSGLRVNDGHELEYRISLDPDGAAVQRPLVVKWRVTPTTLPKGAVTYQVDVVAGQDTLASKPIGHNGKTEQKVGFSRDDFDELDEQARFQALVRVSVLGDNALAPVETESFVLCFGETTNIQINPGAARSAATLALAAAEVAPDWDAFRQLARHPDNQDYFETAMHGFILCKWQGKVAKVFCPPLFRQLADDWIERDGALGRWRLRVREDGAAVGEPEFVPIGDGDGDRALARASAKLAAWLKPTQGPLGVLYLVDELPAVNGYVEAAKTLWQGDDPQLTLIQTLEVQSLAGHCLGLIVLPTHPLRIAWQQSFDLMVAYHRYNTGNADGLPPKKLAEILKPVTGAHYPAFLPGLDAGKSFVFGDILGFHAVAMVTADDPEPKATLARLGRLLGGEGATAPSVGDGAAKALAAELGRYLQLHPFYRRLRVHALRAGDGMPVARALGLALHTATVDAVGEDADDDDRCFELELFPGTGQSGAQTGRFLSATAERRRSGAGSIPEEDRWLLGSVSRPGGVSLPRLRWARRDSRMPTTTAHLAIAFDLFSSRVECRTLAELPQDGVLEAHGLMLMPTREFHAQDHPHWLSYVPPNPKGEQHPFPPMLTKRQIELHAAVMRATARHLGGGKDAWPVLITEVDAEQADQLAQLHDLCDWVMTADRNAGIEYFDSPRDLPALHDAYVIDCVPERDDLGFMQLITSTSKLDEVTDLLDGALGEMGLSSSPRNCRDLLDALKALSGRLALRLAEEGTTTPQMIALAMVQRQCARAESGDEVWLPLRDGILIPVDDVPELFQKPAQTSSTGQERADLLYVAPVNGGLRLALVEVKFRRYLKTARSPDLAATMERQIDASCTRWQQLFGEKTSTLEKTVNRAWLARLLRFYARKGRRYGLSEHAFTALMRRIDLIVQKKADPPNRLEIERIGYVFCPEHAAASPARIESLGGCDLWLFGPGTLPLPGDAAENDASDSVSALVSVDIETDHPSETEAAAPDSHDDEPSDQRSRRITEVRPGDREAGQASSTPVVETSESFGVPVAAAVCPAPDLPVPGDGRILLGYRDPGDTPLYWRTLIQANLHNLYQNMFRRGPQQRITHAVVFDEAHKAARLKLLAGMVKECRKYGLAFVVASQEAKDFDSSLFTAIANYLALRLSEADAKLMAKSFAASDHVKLVADRIKQMPKYSAMYYAEGMPAPTRTRLLEQPPD